MARETYVFDVEFHYANLADKPRKGLSSRLQWDVKCVFDKALLPEIKELGIHIKKDVDDETDAVEYSFMAKQGYSNPKTGEVFRKPNILDANNKRLKGELIGNGSSGKVKISLYDYVYEGKKGKAANLEALKVLKLVEYVREEDPEFAVNEDENDDFAVDDDDNGDY
jgi:hypothetical protein